MIELKPGNFYIVLGKRFTPPPNIVTYDPAMFVREENIFPREWYVFASLCPDHQLVRIRIPTEKALSDIIEGKTIITGQRLAERLITYTKKRKKRHIF